MTSEPMLYYFDSSEFDCKETGENNMNPRFLRKVDEFRAALGHPLVVLSGYRSPQHSLEEHKKTPGTHAQGIAVDVVIPNGTLMRKAVTLALRMQFNGIGVNKGSLHLDDRDSTPVMWGY